jgi:hypothetical protein
VSPGIDDEAAGLPWRPPSAPESLAALSDVELAKRLYVVVEERIDTTIGLLVSPWPGATEDGRLRFDPEAEEVEVAVDLKKLQARLADRDVSGQTGSAESAEALAHRPVEVGDAFAVQTGEPAPELGELEKLSGRTGKVEWMAAVIDITADAREAAKVATYEALTPPLKKDVIAELRSKRGEVAES